MSRKLFRFGAIIGTLLLLFASGAQAQQPGPSAPLPSPRPIEIKKVLILWPSQGLLSPGTQMLYHEIRSEFDQRARGEVALLSESVDLRLFPGESDKRRYAEFFRKRYARESLDLILPVYSHILDFALKYRDILCPGIPVVFTAVGDDELNRLNRMKDVTGVAATVDVAGTIDLARKLHPGLRRLAVVAGTGPVDRYLLALTRRVFKDYEGQLEWIDLAGLPLEELLARVSRLPESTAILYLNMAQEGRGRVFMTPEVQQFVSKSANAPLYSLFDDFLGYGSVGGRMTDAAAIGRKTGEIALRVLSGERAGAIEPVVIRGNPILLNRKEMKRWGIAESALPPGSIVRFREFSVWEHYRWWIVGALAFLCLQTLLIGALVINLAKRKRVEEALTRSETNLKKAQEVGLIGSFVHDAKTNEGNWSVGANELCGVPPDSKLDYEAFLQIVHPDDRNHVDGHWKAALKGKPCDIEHRLVVNDKVKWVRSKAEVEFDEQGRPVAITGIIQDVSRRKQTEEDAARLRNDLFHVTRVSTMGEVSKNLAHEVNQPLTAILVNAEAALRLLDDGQPDLQEVREALGDIVADHGRAREVIQRIRDLVKKESRAHVPVDLNRVASDAVKAVQSSTTARQARILLDLHADLPAVRGDGVQLQQVVLNLLINALEAKDQSTPAPGLITVKTAVGSENNVTLSVSDTGIGIDKQIAERLFQPFFTTKADGLGLGLSISQSIVEGHGGTMGAFSNPERGATFYFRLPAVIAEVPG